MENKELLVVEKVKLVPFFTKGEQVEDLLAQIEKEVLAFVPDVTTAKGRDEIKKMTTKVTKSKTYLESKGKELAAEYKAIPKVIDANRRTVKEKLTALAEQVRAPLTEYEEEAKRKAIEKMEREKAEKLAAEVETAHELALFMNDKFDDERAAAVEAERKAEEERRAIAKAEREAREKRIAEEAAAAAQASAEQAKREAEEAEKARIQAEKQAAIDAEQAELRRIEAEKQAKIDAEKAAEAARQAELDRQKQEAEQLAAEKAKREANKKHIGAIRGAAKECFMAKGLDEATAKKLVLAIHNNEIANVSISY